LPEANVIYVSAGATAPLAKWLNALKRGGRLAFPLTPGEGLGGMLLITRFESAETFAARFISPAAFISCIGARDARTAERLTEVFRDADTSQVRSLQLGLNTDDTCWFAGDGWWLSTKAVESRA